MTKTKTSAEKFKALHIKGDPLVLCNIWDAGSAKIVETAGAKAIATGSWAVAAANGYSDGENLPLGKAMQTLKSIADAVSVPVSVDLESGYGQAPARIADTVKQAADNGAAGLNLEDQIIGKGGLYKIKDQAARIAAASRAATNGTFINARTDVFLQAEPEAHIDELLKEAMLRAQAYHQAGADGLFVPGLINKMAIKVLCENSPIPVNIMVIPNCPDIGALAKLGVARISYGPGPYQAAMATITAQAQSLYS